MLFGPHLDQVIYCIWCINYIQLFFRERERDTFDVILCTVHTYMITYPISKKGGDTFPFFVCLDHRRGSIQVLDGKAPDPQGTMRDVVHLVSARVLFVLLLLSFRKQMKGVGCYGLLMFKRVWLCLPGVIFIKKACVFCVFSNSGKKKLTRWNIFGWRLGRWVSCWKGWCWGTVFTEVSQWKWRCVWLGKIDVERCLWLKDVEI